MASIQNKTTNRQIFEAPQEIEGIRFGDPVQADVERTIVSSEFFAPHLLPERILVQHACWFRPVLTPVKAHLVLARVAGYRHAIYGLPEKTAPVLFEHPEDPDILISTTPIWEWARCRYMPAADWRIVIGRLTAWLEGRAGIDAVQDKTLVAPTFGPDESLPEGQEEKAFTRCSTWFSRYIFFEHAGAIGVFEGYSSRIEPTGRQSPRPKTRGDCSGEAAMVPALDWALHRNPEGKKLAKKIMDHLFHGPELADQQVESPTYGGLRFYEYVPTFYGDDNARAALGCVLASECIGDDTVVPEILRCLLSLLRSTSPQGFRPSALRHPQAFQNGRTWRDYGEQRYIEFHPHYQAYLWAAFLQAYRLTDDPEFLRTSRVGISETMRIFPNFRWNNGISQEYARMLLPLAFLVQIMDTPRHRSWLRAVAVELLRTQHKCGAILERMGDLSAGRYPSPRTNEAYGASEAALIQENGDPACDLLYTIGFAFLGFHEAAVATGESIYSEAADRLAEFLCRIQLTSRDEPYLNGCWMRGFDVDLWECYGSSADNGWGAWCVESGWMNTWISTTLALRKLGRGLLCRNVLPAYRRELSRVREEMRILRAWSTETASPGVTPLVPGAE